MRNILITVVLVLLTTAAYAQAPLTVNINTGKLNWTWTVGVPPNNGTPDGFRMKCGSTSKTYTIITDVVNPAARSVLISAVTKGSGNYFCAVSAYNQFAESPSSNEVNFLAGAPADAPTGLNVSAQ